MSVVAVDLDPQRVRRAEAIGAARGGKSPSRLRRCPAHSLETQARSAKTGAGTSHDKIKDVYSRKRTANLEGYECLKTRSGSSMPP